MANQPDNTSEIRKKAQSLLSSLFTASTNTNYSTYGLGKDLYETKRVLEKLATIQNKSKDAIKRSVDANNLANSRVNSFGLLFGGKNKRPDTTKDGTSIYDVIKSDTHLFGELREQMLLNNKFYNTIGDYEILRRAVPEVSRVINLLINSVLIPEVITSNTFNLKYKFKKSSETEIAKRLKEKYEIDKKIRVIVENYFIIGVEYITVIPYRAVVDAIKNNQKSSIIKESSLGPTTKAAEFITESAFDHLEKKIKDDLKTRMNSNKDNVGKCEKLINDHISGLKVYKSNKRLIYDAALIESIKEDKSSFMLESSFEEFFSKDKVKTTNGTVKQSDPGVVDVAKEYEKIDVHGCKIERLDPARVYPVRLHDTVVAYIYIEERRDEVLQYNLQNQMRNTFAFYRVGHQTSADFTMKVIEDRIIKEIGGRILNAISPKFLETNFKDMDIFYEFLRDNDLHKHRNDIIILHPDDVIEFKRADGSIMKNAVFFLRLYLMMTLNNILTKVRKGSDRTLYYVDNGLSNDIEGSVMEAIEAIQQSEIRVSDLGTITGIMSSVGSVVDLFVPQSSDGSKPINPDVISGQQVDMDEEFLKYLIKSIILSFNMPPVVVDDTNQVDYAKTLSMANLDVATSSALTQSEINPQLTEMFRKIMAYELNLEPDEIETIEASLIPSRSMMMQITNELLGTTKDLANNMADFNIITDDDALKKAFIRDFIRKHLNYDWAEVDRLLAISEENKVEAILKTDARNAAENADLENDAALAGGDDGTGAGDMMA